MTDHDLEPVDERIADLPPSAKLVHTYIRIHGPVDQAELEDLIQLHNSSVRFALEKLIDADAVQERTSTSDARRRVYQSR